MSSRGKPSPYRRLGRRFVAGGATALAVGAVLAVLLPLGGPEREFAGDPSKVGPDRFLTLRSAWVDSSGARPVLRADGDTNLIDHSKVRLVVTTLGAQELQSYSVEVRGGRFELAQAARGTLAPGEYTLTASFLLERQTPSVQKVLHFQPRYLSSSQVLVVEALEGEGASEAKSEFRELFDAVNQAPRDPQVLDDLDRRATELNGRLWISKQKAALKKLRLAIEEARGPRFKREDFERLLLEAHVLADL